MHPLHDYIASIVDADDWIVQSYQSIEDDDRYIYLYEPMEMSKKKGMIITFRLIQTFQCSKIIVTIKEMIDMIYVFGLEQTW